MMRFLFLIYGCFAFTSFSQNADTMHVYYTDTTQISTTCDWIQRPCSKAKFETHYHLRNPKDSTYYFIYNTSNLLVKEGLYTSNKATDTANYRGLSNAKYYYYNKRGKLIAIHYQNDGRNTKTEHFKRGKLKKTTH